MIYNGYIGAEYDSDLNPSFPVSLIVPADPPTVPLTIEEARALAFELTAAANRAEEIGFVRVRVATGGSAVWTYSDPSGELLIGDNVLVPFGYQNQVIPGQVVDLGRGGYNGPAKTVIARLCPVPL